ncbi:hypothetical protein AWB71_04320 [Caballeronia peredens]|nr:hypothetical protein AWB71_04320 [Caballeronia peredens]
MSLAESRRHCARVFIDTRANLSHWADLGFARFGCVPNAYEAACHWMDGLRFRISPDQTRIDTQGDAIMI